MTMLRGLSKLSIYVAAVTLVIACDPTKLVNDYFKGLGLNPLAVVRDDIKPGALIVKTGSTAVYADRIFDFVPGATAPAVTSDNLDKNSDFQAVLRAHTDDRKVNGSVALDFLKAVLPVSITADLGLTDKLTVDAINATGHRLSVPQVLTFLRNNSAPLHDFISQQGSNAEAYVAYETYEADTLNIVSEGGTDVSTKLATTQEFKPLSSGKASFSYARTQKDTLVIKGEHPYVFAVRTGKLVYNNDAYTLQVTNFASGNVKAVGGNEKYAIAVNDGFAPLTIKRTAARK
ncbi:MAG: hypothetical protein C5B58_06885 [Acidobacteria bacterium]|nr:MAG: hypothetical protein C5B58_06885 [Acidobacteriota bacterium]